MIQNPQSSLQGSSNNIQSPIETKFESTKVSFSKIQLIQPMKPHESTYDIRDERIRPNINRKSSETNHNTSCALKVHRINRNEENNKVHVKFKEENQIYSTMNNCHNHSNISSQKTDSLSRNSNTVSILK